MAESPRILSTLKRIAETARKMNSKPRPIHPTFNSPVKLKLLPEHKPLLPLLLSYGIPSKLAQACADRYDKCASKLRSEAETKFAPYLHECTSHSAGVYSSFLHSYTRALRRWAQSILNAALKSLKRTSVELGNLDVTYQKPLWLPSPPHQHPAFQPTKMKPGPLSSASTPPYAFPTTYPPPLRPSIEIPSVEWPRTPVVQPGSPSTSTFDIELLCQRFAKSLVIEENPNPSSENRASIFSLPTTLIGGPVTASSRTKQSKRKSSQTYRKSPTAKSLQFSVPPSHTPSIRSTPRKASVPVTTSSRIPPPTLPDSRYHPMPMRPFSPFPGSTPSSNLERNSNFCTTTHPVRQQPLFGSKVDPVPCARHPSHSPPMPTTPPPIITLDLLYEPTIVSPIAEQLFPGPSPAHFVDPLTQSQLQHNYLLGALFSPSNHDASLLGFMTGDLFSKGAFDTPLGFDYLLGEASQPYFVSP